MLGDLFREQRPDGVGLERRLARQHLEQHAGEAVDVGAALESPLAARLLGTHVRRCPNGEAAVGQDVDPLGINDLCNPEIRQDRMLVRKEDVRRLHVAMHKTTAVHVVESRPDLFCDPQCLAQRERSVGRQTLAKRPSRNVRSDEEELTLALT